MLQAAQRVDLLAPAEHSRAQHDLTPNRRQTARTYLPRQHRAALPGPRILRAHLSPVAAMLPATWLLTMASERIIGAMAITGTTPNCRVLSHLHVHNAGYAAR